MDIGLKVPSKEVAVKVFRDVLGLEPVSSTSPHPMIYILDEHTQVVLGLPDEKPTFTNFLHLSITPTDFDEIVKRLKGVKGIDFTLKTKQSMSGKDRRSVRITFDGSDTAITVMDIL